MPSYYKNKDIYKLKDTSVYDSGTWNELINRYHKVSDTWYPIYTYTWNITPWTKCTVPCGGGTHTRKIQCLRNDGVVKSNEVCIKSGLALLDTETSGKCNTNDCSTSPEPINKVITPCNSHTNIYLNSGYPYYSNNTLPIYNNQNWIGPGWYRVGIAPIYGNMLDHGCHTSELRCSYNLPHKKNTVSTEIVLTNGCTGNVDVLGTYGITIENTNTVIKSSSNHKVTTPILGTRNDIYDTDSGNYHYKQYWYGICYFVELAYFEEQPKQIGLNWKVSGSSHAWNDCRMCCTHCYIVPEHMLPD